MLAAEGKVACARSAKISVRVDPGVLAAAAARFGMAESDVSDVVNASLGSGPLCRRLLSDAHKLAGFRTAAVVERALTTVPAGPARRDDGIGAR